MTEQRRPLDDTTISPPGRRLDRRGLLLRAGALGLSGTALAALGPAFAAAQDASPAAATGETITSMNREEYHELLRGAFAFEEAQNPGGQVIFSQTADIATVNGLLTADYPTAYITTGPIFEPLVGASPIDGQIVPALADWYEIAADGKTYTFHLNKDAKWHDGTDVTAADVQFTYDVALDEKSPNPRRSTHPPGPRFLPRHRRRHVRDGLAGAVRDLPLRRALRRHHHAEAHLGGRAAGGVAE